MADPNTSKRFRDTISELEIKYFQFAQGLKDLVHTHRATTIVADLGTGIKQRAGAIKGGKERGKSFAQRDNRWKQKYEVINAKHPDKNASDIARILLKYIEQENKRDDAPDDPGHIPSFRTMRRMVSGWRRAS